VTPQQHAEQRTMGASETPSVPGPVEGPSTGELRARPLPTRAAGWLLGAVAIVALVGYIANRTTAAEPIPGPTEHAAAAPSVEASGELGAADPQPTLPVAVVAAAHGEPTPAVELALVAVRVTSQPSGARLRVAGGSEVCASTPCRFDAVVGRPLSLQARRGKSQALTTITPVGETELHLVLEAVAEKDAGAGNGAGPQPVSAAESRTLAHDDLKIPEMFRRP
jgi:hypothetical protein